MQCLNLERRSKRHLRQQTHSRFVISRQPVDAQQTHQHAARSRRASLQAHAHDASDATSPLQRLGAFLGPLLASVAFFSQVLWTGPGDAAWAKHRLTAEESSTVDLFRSSTPSVVYITNLASKRDQFTLDMMEIPQGAGSGTVWDTDGHIVTNYHVVKDASEMQVSLTGGFMNGGPDEFKAKLVGFDADKDIAVLKIDVPDKQILHPLKLGESSDLLVGQKVYAIGNPFGLDHTLTTGVISGTGREINSGINGRPIQGAIQTDAAINPGNSGGPLIDSAGELIGINTAIYSPSGANAGIGFAVPIDVLRSSISQIIEHGKVVRPIIGIVLAPSETSEQLGVQGILVLDARKGGPAFKAGIRGTARDEYGRLILGDIIQSYNGKTIKSTSDLYRELDKCQIGDVIDLGVLRENTKERVQITLEPSS